MKDARWKPNVTVAAIVEDDGRYLLVEEHAEGGLRLNNPAGHLDPGESLLQAVSREALEETGRAFTPTHLVGIYLAPAGSGEPTYLRFAFAGVASAPVPGWKLDHGIVRTLWLSPAEIEASQPRHRSPLLWRCVQDHLSGKRYPLAILTSLASLGPET